MSWTKIMKLLMNTLTNDELKDVLFSVEDIGDKKNNNKKLKKILKDIQKKEKHLMT